MQLHLYLEGGDGGRGMALTSDWLGRNLPEREGGWLHMMCLDVVSDTLLPGGIRGEQALTVVADLGYFRLPDRRPPGQHLFPIEDRPEA